MGAVNFHVSVKLHGKTAKHCEDAFNTAVRDAQYWNGHGGYTGTIAEKRGLGFRLLKTFDDDTPHEEVYDFIRSKDIENDKAEPAFAVVYDGSIHFFGMASE